MVRKLFAFANGLHATLQNVRLHMLCCRNEEKQVAGTCIASDCAEKMQNKDRKLENMYVIFVGSQFLIRFHRHAHNQTQILFHAWTIWKCSMSTQG